MAGAATRWGMRQIVIDIRRKKDFVKLTPTVVAIARSDPNCRQTVRTHSRYENNAKEALTALLETSSPKSRSRTSYLQKSASVLPFHLVLVYAFVEQFLIHIHEQLQGIVDQPWNTDRDKRMNEIFLCGVTVPKNAKKETFFTRIFDMSLHTIISGDTIKDRDNWRLAARSLISHARISYPPLKTHKRRMLYFVWFSKLPLSRENPLDFGS